MGEAKKKVLVVGVGSIGERHVRCFGRTGRADLSICEVNTSLRQQVAQRYSVKHAFGELTEALNSQPDVAVICTPAHLHVPLARQVVEVGGHVLIEKPLSTSMDGIEELKQLIDRRGLVAAVAYIWRAHPALAAIKQVMEEGRFGRPVEVNVNSGQHFPYYRPSYRQTYFTSHATGGGIIQDSLTHVINACEWIVGRIDRLVADAKHLLLEGVDVEDTVHLVAQHGSVLASYCTNLYQAPNELTMTIVCEKGTCRFEHHRLRWRWMIEPETEWHDEVFEGLERDDLFVKQANVFLDAVEGKGQPLCSIEEGQQTLRVTLAALQSAKDTSKFIEI